MPQVPKRIGKMAQKEGVKTINIDEELHARLRLEAAKRRASIKELVEAALRLFLAQPS